MYTSAVHRRCKHSPSSSSSSPTSFSLPHSSSNHPSPTPHSTSKGKGSAPSKLRTFTLRHYDAVGPETLSILELLERFARYRHNATGFRPVSVEYINFERMLNAASLGNLNRQFISLLRSEQASEQPILGNPQVWARLLGEGARLTTLDQAFVTSVEQKVGSCHL